MNQDRLWAPIVGVDGWRAETLYMVTMVGWDFMGGLALRCIFPFLEWPWTIVESYLPETSPDDVAGIEEKVRNFEPCCAPPSDGFTALYKRRLLSDSSIESSRQFASDSFGMCQSVNIITEDRFV
jgi:hypothetical protein